MADLLPALSSDDENEQFDEDDDEDEQMEIVFGGLLVSISRLSCILWKFEGWMPLHDNDPIN